ncbi:amidohydrolase/deacetylase family metallohydrolase [Chitinophaga pinensis]|uniref:Dihydroorotase n=1 Tax=Chitinophaga pinensis (strain ATCC 43595 / DSM 2588 / LMG 13176 / NBRC 15968 / NCIMB 11800 / UQM 2034) TaxID=485918 RepID=A0A979GAK5_CHIPD|nr:amidohydrolase/deacetylase family metallohydrolase [Chitinophaga pinensis]ACU63866.1 dihydroorotase [Chitinophaga pinensis DSM 2588]
MKRIIQYLVLLVSGSLLFVNAHAQQYTLLIKGGHVLDPKNGIDAVMDIALLNDTIAKVAANIDAATAKNVVDAKGLYVTPGLIDIHTHNFIGTTPNRYLNNSYDAIAPDGFTFRCGVTTVVDAGSSGWRNFEQFLNQTIMHSKTRVLAFINIVGGGMQGGPYEQDLSDMDGKMTALTIRRYKQWVVGVKVAHYEGAEWAPVDRAVEAGKVTGTPVMIDFGGSNPPLSLEELFMQHLRPGDIFTHAYAKVKGRMSIVDDNGKLRPFVFEARKKGIIFDVGHGGTSFSYSQAVPALKAGFFPNTISTDIHTGSMNGDMKDLLNVMSKFLNMGMSVPELVKATTSEAAKVIRHEELGSLSEHSIADIALLRVENGKFGFTDANTRMEGDSKLLCELTVRAGKIVYDLNGLAAQHK